MESPRAVAITCVEEGMFQARPDDFRAKKIVC